jgi:uncharacterized protein (TIGR00645 family)
VEDDRLAHHRAEAGHAHRQPLGDLPAVQRQVSASSPASHQFSISFGKAVDSMRKLLEQANGLGNIRRDRGPWWWTSGYSKPHRRYFGNGRRQAKRGSSRMNRIERTVETIIYNSRWLVVPFLLGLIAGLVALVYKFIIKLAEFVMQIPAAAPADVMVGILTLVDLTLVANLIVIVICSSYENFVARIDPAEHPDWPEGLIRIGFSGLKQKLLGSIAAIAAVNVLEWFMDIERHADNIKLAWVVGILLAFATAMLILAIADRVSSTDNSSDR